MNAAIQPGNNWGLGHVSRKSRKPLGPEKPFANLRLAHSMKLVFSYFAKPINITKTSKVRASRRICFEDTTRIMSPEMCPKSFRTFKKGDLDLLVSLIISCATAQPWARDQYSGKPHQ